MKILLIIDQFDSANNGTTMSARRFAQTLSAHGNEVRVAACGRKGDNKYVMPRIYFLPIAGAIIGSQGMRFAVADKKLLREAFEWADVAHFLMPLFLEHSALKLCEDMGVPHTAAFHVQPENITSTLGMKNNETVNKALYNGFRDSFYNRFKHIHCPSEFIASQLRAHGYTAKLHVISNGISEQFHYTKAPKLDAFKDKKLIVTVGRYSSEKRQDILIDAISKCRHADEIQLVMAGKGPTRILLQMRAHKLKNRPMMQFFSGEMLRRIFSMSDLYVHAADVEIEAIACIEAFASGLVPVIANSPKSATPQFALDERSLFHANNSDALAEKIDYWLDNDDERRRMEHEYAKAGEKYHIDACVAKAEEMFRQAIEEGTACQ